MTDADKLAEAVKALENASRWFRDYERQHRDKHTNDGDLKADTNAVRAASMEDAIAKLREADRG